jgi:hypothetical protein
MPRLRDLAKLIRSKNAGPFELTFDIMFQDKTTYDQVKSTGVISRQLFSDLYGTPVDQVKFYEYDPAFAFKITIPRPAISGSLEDPDVYGGQQFGPLANLDVPI